MTFFRFIGRLIAVCEAFYSCHFFLLAGNATVELWFLGGLCNGKGASFEGLEATFPENPPRGVIYSCGECRADAAELCEGEGAKRDRESFRWSFCGEQGCSLGEFSGDCV